MNETIHDAIIEKIRESTLGTIVCCICALVGAVAVSVWILMCAFVMFSWW